MTREELQRITAEGKAQREKDQRERVEKTWERAMATVLGRVEEDIKHAAGKGANTTSWGVGKELLYIHSDVWDADETVTLSDFAHKMAAWIEYVWPDLTVDVKGESVHVSWE